MNRSDFEYNHNVTKKHRHPRDGRAFTLIELLVVVSLIVLLIAMLLPALGRARTIARRSACASNLHQIGAAAVTYASSNAGQYPSSVRPGHWSFGGLLETTVAENRPAGPALMFELGMLGGAEMLYCPDAEFGAGITEPHHWRPDVWNHTFTGYPWWGPYWQDTGGLAGVLAYSPKAPADTILTTDLCVGRDFWWLSNHKDDTGELVGGHVLTNGGSTRWVNEADMQLRQSHAGQIFYF